MNFLLKISRLIDALSERIGETIIWLVLAAVLISSINAIVRKVFNMSSNAFLEIQWYLFAGVFLLGAGYTLLRQGHVRIDVVLSRFSQRTQTKVEIFGILFFLMPFVFAVIVEVWPLVTNAYVHHEMSENAGGLVRWPVFALVPLGFALLGLQGISELIKRIGFLMGLCEDPAHQGQTRTAEEELAEEVRKHHVSPEVIDSVEAAVNMADDDIRNGKRK